MSRLELLGSGSSSLDSTRWHFVGKDGQLAFWISRDPGVAAGHLGAYTVKRFVPNQDAANWPDVTGLEAEELVAFCEAAPRRSDIRPDRVKARNLYWAFKAGKSAGVQASAVPSGRSRAAQIASEPRDARPHKVHENTALQIIRDAHAQGAQIAVTMARELKSFRVKPFLHQFILEFVTGKCAVLSVRSRELKDQDLSRAIQAEIQTFIDHRVSRDPSALDAFRRYQDLARMLDETRDIPGLDIALFFRDRFEAVTAALPAANRLFKKRLREEDKRHSSAPNLA